MKLHNLKRVAVASLIALACSTATEASAAIADYEFRLLKGVAARK